MERDRLRPGATTCALGGVAVMIGGVADIPVDGSGQQTHYVPDELPAGAAVGVDAIATQHVTDLPAFGRFQAVARIGAGATGTVYRAHDDVLGRAIAIKTLHVHGDPGVRERFVREARATSSVVHSNVLAVYDVGSHNDVPYLVMELASAGSLRDRMQAGRLPCELVRSIGAQIARALAAVHTANLLHRDVKPANILATAERWKLADFGIARVPDSTLTLTGQFMGSPSYAAPESIRSGTFSPASDVYGLGATLYEALAGSPPHGHHDLVSILRKLDREPPRLDARLAIPPVMVDAIMAALARDPSQRPSAADLARRLENLDPAPRAVDPDRIRKRVAIVMAAVATVVVSIAVLDRSRSEEVTRNVLGESAKPAEDTPAIPDGDGSVSEPPAAAAAEQALLDDGDSAAVDEATARRILEDLVRDARAEYGRIARPGSKRGSHR
ncbi:MAG: serine/threonine-protein kinase [Kofleriaceae bacterium]